MWRIGTRSLVKRPDLRRSCLRSSFAIRSPGRPSSLPVSQCCLSKLYTKKDSETLPVATLPSQLPSTSPLLSLLASWRPTQHKHRGSLRTRALLDWWPSQASVTCDAPPDTGRYECPCYQICSCIKPGTLSTTTSSCRLCMAGWFDWFNRRYRFTGVIKRIWLRLIGRTSEGCRFESCVDRKITSPYRPKLLLIWGIIIMYILVQH